MFCNNCGAEIREGVAFCEQCGKAMNEENKQENKSGNNKSKKPLIITIIAAVLLLTIGIVAVVNTGILNPVQHNLNLGYKYLEEGNYEEALIAFNKVIEIDANNISAHIALFKTYDALGKYEEAKFIIDELIKIDPDNKTEYLDMLKEMNKKISLTENQLLDKLKSETDNNILWKNIDDYDGDGLNEMFAFVGTSYDEYGSQADLWYIGYDESEQMTENKAFYLNPEIWDVNGIKMLYVEEGYGGSGSISHAWIVESGIAKELKNTGTFLSYDGNGNFYTTHSTYDSSVDGSGHTWKRYYLYFDGHEFKEYGGVKITEEQLRKLNGSAEILDDVRNSGYYIGDIFYRDNKIININCTNGEVNDNLTLKLNGNTVELLTLSDSYTDEHWKNSSYGGVYATALFPDIATYPNETPF